MYFTWQEIGLLSSAHSLLFVFIKKWERAHSMFIS